MILIKWQDHKKYTEEPKIHIHLSKRIACSPVGSPNVNSRLVDKDMSMQVHQW
jgi:hypothetical protein